MKTVYFPGLNGVRFIAALLVIIDHIELFKSNFGFKTLWEDSYSSHLGAFGVTIFFVLSGFLITYLLLAEKTNTSINIKNFYFRRILRIWPVYYLIVIIAFFIIPHIEFFNLSGYSSNMDHYKERLFLFSGFLANVAFVYYPTVAFANILWSVSVEEQFYIFWPHIIKMKKHIFQIMVSLLLFYFLSKVLVVFTIGNGELYALITRTRFSSMIIGGIGAYLVFNKKSVVEFFLYNRIIQLIIISLFILLLINKINFPYFGLMKNEFISFVVISIIINVSTNTKSILKLENRVLNYLGKISYGLYVYHLFAVVIILKLLPNLISINRVNSIAGYSLTIIPILLITTIISHFSYYYFEKYFLKKKVKFSNIISGDLVKTQSNKT
jgi:peptidoglycan/LPS O-acetylase OafA/YrhL